MQKCAVIERGDGCLFGYLLNNNPLREKVHSNPKIA